MRFPTEPQEISAMPYTGTAKETQARISCTDSISDDLGSCLSAAANIKSRLAQAISRLQGPFPASDRDSHTVAANPKDMPVLHRINSQAVYLRNTLHDVRDMLDVLESL